MKESIINTLYDNWCNSEFEPEVKEVMDSAIKNPTEDNFSTGFCYRSSRI